MREIKFRFWRPDDKLMMTDHSGWTEDIGINEALSYSAGYGVIAMQFTGLKDNNGVEIYEWDIVDCEGTKYLCVWNEFRCEFAWYTLNGNYVYPIGDCRTFLKILGNPYENPELITL